MSTSIQGLNLHHNDLRSAPRCGLADDVLVLARMLADDQRHLLLMNFGEAARLHFPQQSIFGAELLPGDRVREAAEPLRSVGELLQPREGSHQHCRATRLHEHGQRVEACQRLGQSAQEVGQEHAVEASAKALRFFEQAAGISLAEGHALPGGSVHVGLVARHELVDQVPLQGYTETHLLATLHLLSGLNKCVAEVDAYHLVETRGCELEGGATDGAAHVEGPSPCP
mmetsp:Transcript_28183/g.70809  ORF Transcript_28183/g.70809 Transcript_28183/m.70809 type:complete len:227 (-) Transcript_28183:2197-2877(-)